MTQPKLRQDLETTFSDGQRPTGRDFAALLNSFVHKTQDGLELKDGTLVLIGGVQLDDVPSQDKDVKPGTLCFRDGHLRLFDGNGWRKLAEVTFRPVGQDAGVVYEGNVGIGDVEEPNYRLEVELGKNTGEPAQVRLGAVVCSNGAGFFGKHACFSHKDCAATSKINHSFALRQAPEGEVWINAPEMKPIKLCQGGDDSPRLTISTSGAVLINTSTELKDATSEHKLQVEGKAIKSDGGDMWSTTSDARVKEDIRDLEVGLEELLAVRPVRFRYNGRAGTAAGREGVGVVGQEIEQVLPETVEQVDAPDDLPGDEGLRIYNGSALTYVLVNAVQELAAKVEGLEKTLAESAATRR